MGIDKSKISEIIEQMKLICDTRGEVFTCQRREVLLYLLKINEFIEAEDLWLLMVNDKIKISLPSVFAATRWFTKIGIVEQQKNTERRQVYRMKKLQASQISDIT